MLELHTLLLSNVQTIEVERHAAVPAASRILLLRHRQYTARQRACNPVLAYSELY